MRCSSGIPTVGTSNAGTTTLSRQDLECGRNSMCYIYKCVSTKEIPSL